MKKMLVDTSALSLFRFLAVVTVIHIHYGPKAQDAHFIGSQITRGGSIITFFFILSGLGLYLGYGKREEINFKKFFIKRSIRILPFYYLAFFLMTIILLVSNRFSPAEFFLALFCIQSWFPNFQHAINPPSWFVANLLFFYGLFPQIFHLIKRWKPDPFRFLLSGLSLWALMIVLHNGVLANLSTNYYNYIDCFPISWLPSFYLGICGAYFITSREDERNFFTYDHWLYTGLIVILCSIVLIFHQGELAESIESKIPFEANLYAPLFLLMILNLSTAKNFVTKILSIHFFALLATISYPLYILQAPVHSIYKFLISDPLEMHTGVSFALFLVVFIFFASVLTLVEIKTFNWIQKHQSSSKTQ